MHVEKVGKTISYLRKVHGMTQKDLAKHLDVSDKAVSKWERGMGIPDVSLLAKLSIVLDTDIESILEGNLFHSQKSWCGMLILDTEENPDVFAGSLIYDKPLVHYQLSNFLLVGIRDILIVCNSKDAGFASSNLKDGQELGVTLRYLDCDAYSDALVNEFADGRNVMVLYGANLIYGVDLTKNFQRVMWKDNPVTAIALNYPSVDASAISFDDERRVFLHRNRQKEALAVQYYLLPFFFYKGNKIAGIRKDYHSEFARLMEEKLLFAEPLGRGMVTFQVESAKQILQASEFVQIVQNVQQDQIANLQDIALRRGLRRENNLE